MQISDEGQINIGKSGGDNHPDQPVFRLNQVRTDRENFVDGNQ